MLDEADREWCQGKVMAHLGVTLKPSEAKRTAYAAIHYAGSLGARTSPTTKSC